MSSDNSPETKGTEDTISSDAADTAATNIEATTPDAATPEAVSASSKPAINTEAKAVIDASEKDTPANEPTTSDASASEAAATSASPAAAEAPAPSVSKPAPVAQVSSPAAQPTPPTPSPSPSPSPSIAERVQVPAQAPSGASDESGGEWEMLSGRIKDFWEANNLVEWWQSLRQPLVVIGVLIGLILTLRIYGGILDAIATVPLAPRVFQLVGTIYAAWYAATRLVKSDERKKVSSNLQDLWNSIRGGRKG